MAAVAATTRASVRARARAARRCTSSASSSTARPRCCQTWCRRCRTGWMTSRCGRPCCSPRRPRRPRARPAPAPLPHAAGPSRPGLPARAGRRRLPGGVACAAGAARRPLRGCAPAPGCLRGPPRCIPCACLWCRECAACGARARCCRSLLGLLAASSAGEAHGSPLRPEQGLQGGLDARARGRARRRPLLPGPGSSAGASTAIAAAAALQPKPRRRTGNDEDELRHPLLGDEPTLQLLPPRDAVGARPRAATAGSARRIEGARPAGLRGRRSSRLH